MHFNLTSKKLETVNKLDESHEITVEDFGEEIGMTLPGFKIQPAVPKKLYINHNKEVQDIVPKYHEKPKKYKPKLWYAYGARNEFEPKIVETT